MQYSLCLGHNRKGHTRQQLMRSLTTGLYPDLLQESTAFTHEAGKKRTTFLRGKKKNKEKVREQICKNEV